MRDPVTPLTQEQAGGRRKSVRRTALAFGAVAVAIYVLFLLSGIVGR